MQGIDITLAERGRIVIPKEARDALGLNPGLAKKRRSATPRKNPRA